MTKGRIAVFTFSLSVSLLFLTTFAFSATVFGPKERPISRWNYHYYNGRLG